MGHLINPVAFRVGWTKNWCDSWFSEFSYYPEFLHEILRIRLYLNYFFSLKYLVRRSILLNNFIIFYKSNVLFVRIFFYAGLFYLKILKFFKRLVRFSRGYFYKRSRFLLRDYRRFISGIVHGQISKSSFSSIRPWIRNFIIRRFGRYMIYDERRQIFFFRKNLSSSVFLIGDRRRSINRIKNKKGKKLELGSKYKHKHKYKRFKFNKKIYRFRHFRNFFLLRIFFRFFFSPIYYYFIKKLPRKSKLSRISITTRFFGIKRWIKLNIYKKRSRFSYWRNLVFRKRGLKKLTFLLSNNVNFFSNLMEEFFFIRVEFLELEKKYLNYLNIFKQLLDNNNVIFSYEFKSKIVFFFEKLLKLKEILILLRGFFSNFRKVFIFFFSLKYGINKLYFKFINLKKFYSRLRFIERRSYNMKNFFFRVSTQTWEFKKELLRFFRNVFKYLRVKKEGLTSFIVYIRRVFLKKRNKFLFFKKGFFKTFIVYILFFNKFFSFSRRLGSLKNFRYNFFIRHFTFINLFLYSNYGIYFKFFNKFLFCIFNILTTVSNIKIEFFFVGNYSVTALFLSRYLCKKLSHGFRVKEIMRPIRKELRILTRKFVGRLSFSFLKRKTYVNFFYRKSVLKSYLLKIFFIYKRLFLKFFIFNNTWFNSYMIWFFIFFSKKYFYSLNILVGLSKIFMLKKYAFLFFFSYNFNNVFTNISSFFDNAYYDFFFKNHIFYFFLFDDLFSGFNVIFNNGFKYPLEPTGYLAINFFFNRIVRYGFWNSNFNWLSNFSKINKRKVRMRISSRDFLVSPTLLGYKIFFRGRFSRKLRAASIWFRQGRIPLNKVSANIDYSFSSVPLRNSLVSVKVWLYKSKNFKKWFFKQF